MDETLKRLREERQRIWKQMCDTMEESRSAEGGLTGELRSKYEAAEKDLDAKTAEIETRERHVATESRLNAPRGTGAEQRAEHATADPSDYSAAFRTFMRKGMSMCSPEQRQLLMNNLGDIPEARDLGVATGSAGGYLVPQGFLVKITERLKYYGAMRVVANNIQTASGNAMPWPNNDDTGNVASVLGENTVVTSLDAVLTTKTLNAFMWTTGLIAASLQLLNDSAFDVEGFIADRFAIRLGRGQNTAFTSGNGASSAQGILSGAGGAPILAQTPVFTAATGNTTAVTYANLIETQHALDVAYRRSQSGKVGWQMHDTTMKVIRKLTDTNGRPLWVPQDSYGSITSGAQGDLLGYPVWVNNDMAVPAANAYTIGFGDWHAHYLIRDVLGFQMIRLDERYADKLQVGFIGFARTDGRVDDAYAVSFHQQSAT